MLCTSLDVQVYLVIKRPINVSPSTAIFGHLNTGSRSAPVLRRTMCIKNLFVPSSSKQIFSRDVQLGEEQVILA